MALQTFGLSNVCDVELSFWQGRTRRSRAEFVGSSTVVGPNLTLQGRETLMSPIART